MVFWLFDVRNKAFPSMLSLSLMSSVCEFNLNVFLLSFVLRISKQRDFGFLNFKSCVPKTENDLAVYGTTVPAHANRQWLGFETCNEKFNQKRSVKYCILALSNYLTLGSVGIL